MSEILLHSLLVMLFITIIASFIRANALYKEGTKDSIRSITRITVLKNPEKDKRIRLSNIMVVIMKFGIALGAILGILGGIFKEIGM